MVLSNCRGGLVRRPTAKPASCHVPLITSLAIDLTTENRS